MGGLADRARKPAPPIEQGIAGVGIGAALVGEEQDIRAEYDHEVDQLLARLLEQIGIGVQRQERTLAQAREDRFGFGQAFGFAEPHKASLVKMTPPAAGRRRSCHGTVRPPTRQRD